MNRLRPYAAWGAAYAALSLLVLWTATLATGYLLAAAAALVACLFARRFARRRRPAKHRPDRAYRAALAVLALATLAAAVGGYRLQRVASDWDRIAGHREAALHDRLHRDIQREITRGEAVARSAARLPSDLAFDALAELRHRSGVTAVFHFDGTGELVAWAGEHRGRIPGSVTVNVPGIAYAEGPLFGYLYFTEPLEGRDGIAAAALLVHARLGLREGREEGIADRFAAHYGLRPDFRAGPGEPEDWHLVLDGDTLAHAEFDRLSQAEWHASVATTTRRIALGMATLAFLLLAIAWYRGAPRRLWPRAAGRVPLLAAVPLLAVAPIAPVLDMDRLFSPALFMLPVFEVSLGRLLVVLLPFAALAATTGPPRLDRARLRVAIVLGTLAVAFGFAAGIRVLLAGAAAPLLESPAHLWGGYLATGVLLLATLVALAMPEAAERRVLGRRVQPWMLVTLGMSAAAGLGVAVAGLAGPNAAVSPWLPALWGAAFVPVALGLAAYSGRGSHLARWLAAGWLAVTAVMPQLWVAHMDARIHAAEREIATFGTQPDPYLEYLLRQLAGEASIRYAEGDRGIDLLYGSWLASGLAREPYPLRLNLWTADRLLERELALAGAVRAAPIWDVPPAFLEPALERAAADRAPLVESVHDRPEANKVLVVPLGDAHFLSAVVPPRRSLDRTTVMGPFLGVRRRADTRMDLVPAPPDQPVPLEGIEWRRTEAGWQSEVMVRYPEGAYHAHYELRLPPLGVHLARGVLILALCLGVLAGLWVVGRAARGGVLRPPGGWTVWLAGFRTRVTLALFLFFLVPTALFGWAAYRALAGEVARAARVVAERAVAQAVQAFPGSGGNLHALSAHTGEEVLYYYRGELAGASSAAAFEMGLYEAWMPPTVHRILESGEEMGAVYAGELGGRPYLVAFRRLPPAGTLAVPVWLTAGDAAVRQREMAHLVLFGALVGGILSLGLSVAVGRALADPIGRLRRAAADVGSGRLRVELPDDRTDEFGQLFASFNVMVRRLREARAQELRTARVLAWGEMARQVAHEIKNPLTPIKLSVQHLRRVYEDDRPDYGRILDENVDHVLAEIDRLTEIARAFSRYGAPPAAAGPLASVDVAAVVREALTLYRAGDADVEYRDEIAKGLPPAAARSHELKEVILNLVENARAAVDGQGRILVRVDLADGRPDALELTVQDDGPGIPPDLLPRIFEPHFSTRSSGTGLGLAIVRRLVESWGGEVYAESDPDRGTTVRVTMQVSGAETGGESGDDAEVEAPDRAGVPAESGARASPGQRRIR